MRVDEIDTPDVLQVLDPIWISKNRTVKILQSRIENVLNAASAKGHRDQFNPARWRGHLDKILPKPNKVFRTEHRQAVPFSGFISRLRADGSIASQALEFVILTACQSDCARTSTWDQIDLVDKVRTIPATAMKSGKEFRIPLSSAAQQQLIELPQFEDHDHLFYGRLQGKPIGPSAMIK